MTLLVTAIPYVTCVTFWQFFYNFYLVNFCNFILVSVGNYFIITCFEKKFFFTTSHFLYFLNKKTWRVWHFMEV